MSRVPRETSPNPDEAVRTLWGKELKHAEESGNDLIVVKTKAMRAVLDELENSHRDEECDAHKACFDPVRDWLANQGIHGLSCYEHILPGIQQLLQNREMLANQRAEQAEAALAELDDTLSEHIPGQPEWGPKDRLSVALDGWDEALAALAQAREEIERLKEEKQGYIERVASTLDEAARKSRLLHELELEIKNVWKARIDAALAVVDRQFNRDSYMATFKANLRKALTGGE